MLRTAWFTLLALSVGLGSPARAQQSAGTFGQPRTAAHWKGGSGLPGIGLGGYVLAWEVFDDGSGPAVYAAGWFHGAGDVQANGIARWSGSEWEAVGSGIELSFAQEIRALAVYDDGSGPALYAAGQFDEIGGQPASGFARWDGKTWEVLPGEVGFGFHTLVVGDTGEGLSLFAGGEFIRVGGVNADNVARWDGAWRPVGPGIPLRTVYSLAFFDDGGGESLYAGTQLTSGESSLRRFDGAAWNEVSGAPAAQVNALRVFDDGSGAELALGCGFLFPSAVFSFDGSSFTPLGTLSQSVFDLDLLPGPGSTDLLVAGGDIFSAGGNAVGNVTFWDGAGWQPFGSPAGTDADVEAMAVLDVGSGPGVYVGGLFSQAGSEPVLGAALWDGTDWSPLAGEQFGMDNSVNGFLEYDAGNGVELYAFGAFENSGLSAAGGLASWNGMSWDEVGGGVAWTLGTINAVISDAVVFPSGDGPVLVAVGTFNEAGGTMASNVARWNGSSWAPLGSGIVAGAGTVRSVEVFGSLVYVGGTFTASANQPGERITAWDGVSQTWSALPGDLSSSPPSSQTGPEDLAVFDDGNGALLYVGGDFDFANGILVENLARWDGTSWSAVPFGGLTSQLSNAEARQCVAVDVPSVGGPALIVRGAFDCAGSLPVEGLAWLDATGWKAPGGFSRGTIQTVGVVDDELYAIDQVDGLVRWDGTDWIEVGGGALGTRPSISSTAFGNVIYAFDDGTCSQLFVGGSFDDAGPLVSTDIARFDLGGRAARLVPRNP